MRRYREILLIAALLVTTSIIFYVIQWEIFRDVRDAVFYLLQDLAFLPIQVLLVAIIVERILARREKNRLLHKMNMVIGTFFSELGTRLLGDLSAGLVDRPDVVRHLAVGPTWTTADFRQAIAWSAKAEYRIDLARLDLPALKATLLAQRQLLVLLLANPNLMEHERFTDLLWSVSHLMEELAARPRLEGLPETDRRHLEGDVKRVYGHLAGEWLRYTRHLQQTYPYIYSVVCRMHPLQENPSATVV
jgi:hypothetical protein